MELAFNGDVDMLNTPNHENRGAHRWVCPSRIRLELVQGKGTAPTSGPDASVSQREEAQQRLGSADFLLGPRRGNGGSRPAKTFRPRGVIGQQAEMEGRKRKVEKNSFSFSETSFQIYLNSV